MTIFTVVKEPQSEFNYYFLGRYHWHLGLSSSSISVDKEENKKRWLEGWEYEKANYTPQRDASDSDESEPDDDWSEESESESESEELKNSEDYKLQGNLAFKAGLSLDNNPYVKQRSIAKLWDNGYEVAKQLDNKVKIACELFNCTPQNLVTVIQLIAEFHFHTNKGRINENLADYLNNI